MRASITAAGVLWWGAVNHGLSNAAQLLQRMGIIQIADVLGNTEGGELGVATSYQCIQVPAFLELRQGASHHVAAADD